MRPRANSRGVRRRRNGVKDSRLSALPARRMVAMALAVSALVHVHPSSHAAAHELTVVRPAGAASFAERLAAREVRRYVYLRTGTLARITDTLPRGGDAIVLCVKGDPICRGLADGGTTETINTLKPQQYLLKTLEGGPRRGGGRKVLLVAGGDATGTLYGASFVTGLHARFGVDIGPLFVDIGLQFTSGPLPGDFGDDIGDAELMVVTPIRAGVFVSF